VDGRLQQTFEYAGDLLVKENVFGFCITNPSDEYAYSYSGDNVSTIHLTIRSIYSNLSSVCDPAKGLRATEHYEYNNDNMLTGITRDNSQTIFTYNSQGFVEKQVLSFAQEELQTTYEDDPKGNLIAETDSDGDVTRYEYDDRENPFYYMSQRPGWISPFNKSPNNVIRATGQYNFEKGNCL